MDNNQMNQQVPPVLGPTKKCKYCKMDIPKDAKICPYCKKKQKGKVGLIITILVIIVLLYSCSKAFGSTSDDSSKSSTSTDQATTTAESTTDTTTDAVTEDTAPVEEDYSVGDTIEDNGLSITLVSCEDYTSDNQFVVPADGNKYVKLVFEIANNTGSSTAVSSMLLFSAYADDYAINQTIVSSDDPTLDGEVADGKKLKGTIFYEIPTGTKILQVDYKSNVWIDKKLSFIINY